MLEKWQNLLIKTLVLFPSIFSKLGIHLTIRYHSWELLFFMGIIFKNYFLKYVITILNLIYLK